MIIPANIKCVLDTLNSFGFDAFLVGGCVRDTVMGYTPKDYDVTTNALPEEILNCFPNNKTLATGIKHGTVTVISENAPVEITTYRIDGEYTDFRRPKNVTFSADLGDDLSRRDFTVNAICFNEAEGYIDMFGGLDDIKNRKIRCVGEPEKRFSEDALRIMRALRFSAVLDFDIDEKTSFYIHRLKDLLVNISAERIAVELTKLLCGKRAGDIVREYADVFKVIIPSCSVLDAKAFERIARLLDSCDKNSCSDIMGLCCFFSEYSAFENCNILVSNALKNLKCSKHTVKTVSEICTAFDDELYSDSIFCRRLIQRLGYQNAYDLLSLKALNKDTYSGVCKEIYDKLLYMEAHNECVTVAQLEISGSDLVHIGVPKSRILGDILNTLLEEKICEKLKNNREILLCRAKQLYEEKESIND